MLKHGKTRIKNKETQRQSTRTRKSTETQGHHKERKTRLTTKKNTMTIKESARKPQGKTINKEQQG